MKESWKERDGGREGGRGTEEEMGEEEKKRGYITRSGEFIYYSERRAE